MSSASRLKGLRPSASIGWLSISGLPMKPVSAVRGSTVSSKKATGETLISSAILCSKKSLRAKLLAGNGRTRSPIFGITPVWGFNLPRSGT